MKVKFREVRLSKMNRERLVTINSIIEEYQKQGFKLTLRQLYYQLVSRDVIPNKQSEYAKLSTVLKEGRMAGVVDWNAIEDRLRVPSQPASFDSPQDILDAAIGQYMLPRMQGQPYYLEVWVEKDALSGVLKRVTQKYHIPILINRGYSSVSAMYDAYNRFLAAREDGQGIRVLYLGDYDPSGIDMIRDIADRTMEFATEDDIDFQIVPIALTRGQIGHYKPPPNPAKTTDPRAKDFIQKHGKTSWEVDALRPEVLMRVLTDAIEEYIDIAAYEEILEKEKTDREKLVALKTHL